MASGEPFQRIAFWRGVGHGFCFGDESVAKAGIDEAEGLGGGGAKGGLGVGLGESALGGEEELSGFDPITEIPNEVYLTGFYSNYPD